MEKVWALTAHKILQHKDTISVVLKDMILVVFKDMISEDINNMISVHHKDIASVLQLKDMTLAEPRDMISVVRKDMTLADLKDTISVVHKDMISAVIKNTAVILKVTPILGDTISVPRVSVGMKKSAMDLRHHMVMVDRNGRVLESVNLVIENIVT